MVPEVGLEPTLCYQNWILNPARLPISPLRQDLRGAEYIFAWVMTPVFKSNILCKSSPHISPVGTGPQSGLVFCYRARARNE
jgi:hypothetical protein